MALQREHPELHPGSTVLVGVSGGRDSVALLHYLATAGWRSLVVAHLHHQLRGAESDADASFVKRLAKGFGLTCEVRRQDVAVHARDHKQSIELAARNVRESFFQELADKHGTPFVLLAHHAEDQAETVLGNLCRGAGLHGLTGMPRSSRTRKGLVKVRPLLEVRRAEVDAYLAAHRLNWREDSSNKSGTNRRNRLRHEVMPVLAEVCGRDVVELMLRTVRLTARDEAFLNEEVLRLAEKEGLWQTDGSLLLSRGFKEVHPALQARVLRRWLVEVQQIPAVGVHEVDGAMEMLRTGGPARVNLPGGSFLRRKSGRLWIQGRRSD